MKREKEGVLKKSLMNGNSDKIKILGIMMILLFAASGTLFAQGYTTTAVIEGKAVVEEGKMPVVKTGGTTVVLMIPRMGFAYGNGPAFMEDAPEGDEPEAPEALIKDGDSIVAEGYYLPSRVAGLDIRTFRPTSLRVNGKDVSLNGGRGCGNGPGINNGNRQGRKGNNRKGNNDRFSKKGSGQRNGFGPGRTAGFPAPESVEINGEVVVEEYKDVLLKTNSGNYILKCQWKDFPSDFTLKTGDRITVKGDAFTMPISGVDLKIVHPRNLTKGGKTIILPKRNTRGFGMNRQGSGMHRPGNGMNGQGRGPVGMGFNNPEDCPAVDPN